MSRHIRAAALLMGALLLATAAEPAAARSATTVPDHGRPADQEGWLAGGRQSGGGAHDLATLVAEVRSGNPQVLAARERAEAAGARVPQAGAPPDPMLAAGAMWAPLDFNVRGEMMSMFPIRLSQRIPALGTLRLRRSAAAQAHEAAVAEADAVELDVITRLKAAYHEALFIEAALDVLDGNRSLLVDVADVARARFAVGRVPQQDVLRAQTEITRLEEQTAGLRARHAAALAEVNAILQRPPDEPLRPVYPESLLRLATAAPEPGAFTAAALDGGLGSDLPTLSELRLAAMERRPMLRAHVHRIGATRRRVELAERQRWPEIELMLEYAPRPAGGDVVSAMVAVELPIFAGRKQRQRVVEARHELTDHELRHHQMVHEIESEIAARYAAALRTREQILLLSDGVIPQAVATLESATAAYQAGRVEFAGLLDAQAVLFRHEIELARQLADFGRELAALERAVGFELNMEQGR